MRTDGISLIQPSLQKIKKNLSPFIGKVFRFIDRTYDLCKINSQWSIRWAKNSKDSNHFFLSFLKKEELLFQKNKNKLRQLFIKLSGPCCARPLRDRRSWCVPRRSISIQMREQWGWSWKSPPPHYGDRSTGAQPLYPAHFLSIVWRPTALSSGVLFFFFLKVPLSSFPQQPTHSYKTNVRRVYRLYILLWWTRFISLFYY